jgi:uncharacterized protein YdaU (DUF1376 family)
MKAPAFQFYAADYLADEQVQLMTLEEEGAYIRLLSYCWREGSIPADEVMLSRLCKGADSTVLRVVTKCFSHSATDNTRLVHKRLELEREKQQKWAEKSSTGGRNSAESKKLQKTNQLPKGGSTLLLLSSSSDKPLSPFQAVLDQASTDIHQTHPPNRRDIGPSEVRKRLVAILKHKRLVTAEGKPLDETAAYVRKIVAIHQAKSESEDWTKNGGEYAKALSNYLAATMERYEQEPPTLFAARASPVRDVPAVDTRPLGEIFLR